MKPLNKDPLNLIIAGVGGQGNILASQVIAQAALLEGLETTIGETYGVSQRGGSVMSHVRLTATASPGPLIPLGQADLLLGFEPLETFKVAMDYANPSTCMICNPRPVYPIGVIAGDMTYPSIEQMLDLLKAHVATLDLLPAADIAKEAGEMRAMNLVMVGALAATGRLPLEMSSYEKALKGLFQGRTLKTNWNAFQQGYKAIRGVRDSARR